MRAAQLASSILIPDIGDAKKLAKATLVTLGRAGQIAMAAPEIAARVQSAVDRDEICAVPGTRVGSVVQRTLDAD